MKNSKQETIQGVLIGAVLSLFFGAIIFGIMGIQMSRRTCESTDPQLCEIESQVIKDWTRFYYTATGGMLFLSLGVGAYLLTQRKKLS